MKDTYRRYFEASSIDMKMSRTQRIGMTYVGTILLLFIQVGIYQVSGQTTEQVTTAQQNQPTQAAAPNPQPTGSSGSGNSNNDTINDFWLGDICLNDSNCNSTVANSLCKDAGDNSETMRCACDNKYYMYSRNRTEKTEYKCGRMLPASNAACQQCAENQGNCVEDSGGPTGTFCQCPISRTGTNCEDIHVNVSCTMNAMRICYSPHPEVDFNNGWLMYTESHSKVALCWGSSVADNGTFCSPGNQELVLSLNDTDLDACGTTPIQDTHNKRYSNQIVVEKFDENGNAVTNAVAIVFNVYCSFTAYKDQTFNGIGIGRVNGNDQGTQVNPKLTFNVTDQFDRPMPPGVTIRVGDYVKFAIYMVLDGNYGSLQVLRCTASTSPVMPDSTAETRALTSGGCPIAGEVTADSWYWSSMTAGNQLKVYSKPVPMFKLSSSNDVFIHCALKLCLVGDTSCPNKAKGECPTRRRKRSAADEAKEIGQHPVVIHRQKRATKDVDIQTGLKVEDPNASAQSGASPGLSPGSSGFNALIAVLVIIAVFLIVATVVVAWRMNRKRSANSGYQSRPQLFALPRISRTHERF